MKSKLFKKLLSMFLVGIFILATGIPAGAHENTNTNESKVVYTDENGNRVLEGTKDNGEKGYIIIAKGEVFNDLSDETKVKELANNNANKEVIGERHYFAFADNLEDATELAKINATPDKTKEKYSIQSAYYFWGNGSYIDTGWNSTDYYHVRVHLASNDVTLLSSQVASWAGIALGTALNASGKVTKGRAAVIAGAAVTAINVMIWAARNPDGTMDLFSPDGYSNDHNPVYAGDYLGKFRFGFTIFSYYYLYWQTGYSPLSL